MHQEIRADIPSPMTPGAAPRISRRVGVDNASCVCRNGGGWFVVDAIDNNEERRLQFIRKVFATCLRQTQLALSTPSIE